MRQKISNQTLWQTLLGIAGSLWYVREVVAQVREDREVLLAPALEVFTGKGTPEEIYYVSIVVVAAALLIAVVAVNVMLMMHKFSLKLLVRVFGLWFIFAAGISTISLSYYVTQRPTEPIIRADEEARPRYIRVKISEDQVVVTWRTVKQTRGQVIYQTNQITRDQIILSNAAQPTGDHQVTINITDEVQRLELSIISDGVEYRQDGERLVVDLQ